MSTVLDCETTSADSHSCRLLGCAIKVDTAPARFLVPTDADVLKLTQPIIAHNGKFDAVVYARYYGVAPVIQFDTMIAAYLLHIDRRRKLESLAYEFLDTAKEDLLGVYNRTTGNTRKNLPADWFEHVPHTELARYAEADAETEYALYQYFLNEFSKDPILYEWFTGVEMPVLNLLVQSELRGVQIDRGYLQGLRETLLERTKYYQIKIGRHVPLDMNLNSPKQLNKLLFDTLELHPIRRTKTGFSTDHRTLELLSEVHCIPKWLLRLRELDKLVTGFVIPLLEKTTDETPTIHTTYNQALTDTRRFSSENPNLQNIPVKTAEGKKLRGAFKASPNTYFGIFDYDQIELRLLAHFSQDETLCSLFESGVDIHDETSKMINVDRRVGKILNFSLIYGKTAYGLAQDLRCSEADAQAFIDAYFARFPGVRQWMLQQHEHAIAVGGWTRSLADLPLFVNHIYSHSTKEREHAKRCAVNYPIQSSSQDVLKLAMVQIQKDCQLVPVLMVHDELVYELPITTSPTAMRDRIVDIMEHVVKLRVLLKVTARLSPTWEKL